MSAKRQKRHRLRQRLHGLYTASICYPLLRDHDDGRLHRRILQTIEVIANENVPPALADKYMIDAMILLTGIVAAEMTAENK